MKLRHLYLALAAAAVLLLCAAPPAAADEDPTLFDVNDLNFLFPLDPATGMPHPEIKVTDSNGPNEADQIWPAHLFTDVTTRAGTKDDEGKGDGTVGQNTIGLSPGQANIENWRVVGVRFIPCVLSRKTITGDLIKKPDGTPGFPGCVTQVRLVAQPFVNNQAQDVAAHLVYSIGVVPVVASFDEFVNQVNPEPTDPPTLMQQAAKDLEEIKAASTADTDGQPMQPHPGLVAELGKDQRPLGDLVKKFVEEHTQPRTMTNISFMGLDSPEPWIFFGGDLGPDPQAKDEDGKTAREKPEFKTSDLTFVPKGGIPTDEKSSPAIMLSFVDDPNVQPVPNDLATAKLFGEHEPSDKGAVFAIDNPGLNHNFNLDCISCHTTTTRAHILEITAGDKRFPSPAGITGFVHPDSVPRSDWNVHIFSHFIHPFGGVRKRPDGTDITETISTRTLAEIIDATHLMNDIQRRKDTSTSASTEPAGPGLDCPDEAQVWNCTIHDAHKDDFTGDCFAGCSKAKKGS